MDLTPAADSPRLILTPDRLAQLRGAREGDDTVGRLCAAVIQAADRTLDRPVAERAMQGRRLLLVSRQVLQRVTTLALAARLTDDERYARRAEAEMVAVAAFFDWNPSHFLDVGEMTAALALGLDWLDGQLTEAGESAVVDGILKHGLRVGRTAIDAGKAGWLTAKNNWGQVCGGGLALGSLAVWEHEPELAAGLIREVLQALPAHAMRAYAPDGAYPEGGSYWHYGTMYNLLLIDALRTALGDDRGLADQPGFRESAGYINAVTSPTLDFHQYQDAFAAEALSMEGMCWFAGHGGQPEAWYLGDRWMERYLAGPARRSRFLAPVTVWALALPEGEPPAPPLSWMGRGVTPVGTHRSAWGDPGATWLSIKGGRANAPHGHADVGSFAFASGGVTWAVDLGAQSYHELEAQGVDLWDGRQDGQRWQIFRLGPWSHNIVLLDGQQPPIGAQGEIVAHASDGDAPQTRFDLSPLYAGQARRVTRMAGLIDDRANGLVRDRLEGAQPGFAVRWAMTTHADVTLDGHAATLTQDSQTLRVVVLAPADARLEVLDISEPVEWWDAPNSGARQLLVHTTVPASGDLQIAVELRRQS